MWSSLTDWTAAQIIAKDVSVDFDRLDDAFQFVVYDCKVIRVLLKVSTMAVATSVLNHGAMEEGGQCWVWANHGSCNPCRCFFSITNLSIFADHYVARDTAPCQKAIVQELLEDHKREGVWHSISSGYKKREKKCLKCLKMTKIYFPAGDSDVRARVSVCMPVCISQYEGV